MTPSHVRYRAAPRPDRRPSFSQSGRSSSRREELSDRLEPLAHAPQSAEPHGVRHAELELLGAPPGVGAEPLLRALQREALLIEEPLDDQHQVDVALSVEPLSGGVLLRA